MKLRSKMGWMPLVCTLTMAPLVSADSLREADGVSKNFASAFSGLESSSLRPMTRDTMEETKGEVWPLIAAIVATDIALASYFWGVYVPSVSNSGGQCGAACDTPDTDNH